MFLEHRSFFLFANARAILDLLCLTQLLTLVIYTALLGILIRWPPSPSTSLLFETVLEKYPSCRLQSSITDRFDTKITNVVAVLLVLEVAVDAFLYDPHLITFCDNQEVL